MIKMKFHWKSKEGKIGSFTVESKTVRDCLDIAHEEIGDATMTDWYKV